MENMMTHEQDNNEEIFIVELDERLEFSHIHLDTNAGCVDAQCKCVNTNCVANCAGK